MSIVEPKRKPGYAIGRHLVADFKLCDYVRLSDTQTVEQSMLNAARVSGATIVDSKFRHFDPHGVSGFVIISESHFSIHTWPEYSYAAVDIFTCGDGIDFDIALESLKKAFGAQTVEIVADMYRGAGNLHSPYALDITSTQKIDISHPSAVSWERLFNATNAWGMVVEVELLKAEKLKENSLSEFLINFGKSLNLVQTCEPECLKHTMYELLMCNIRFRRAHASIYAKENTSTHYFELFTMSYFDPQLISRIALELSGAMGYRLRVALRR